jgi:uncharacterized membrane protein
MATSSAVAVRRPQSRFKYVIFSILGLMFLFVLWNNERFILDHSHPDWTYYFPVRYMLIPHGLGGLMALLIGPLQLSSRFRSKHVRIHRILGGFYIGGITLAATMGSYIATVHSSVPLRVFTYVTAVTWLLCAWTALASVLKSNYQQHRQWMIRSYAVTTLFVTARVAFALPILKRLGPSASAEILWTILVLTLIFTELGLAWSSIFGRRRPASRVAVAT